MSIADKFILFWLLPSLATFLICLFICRDEGETIQELDPNLWVGIGVVAIFYPMLLILLLAPAWKIIIKERKWWWQK